jgi:integrase
MASMAPKPPKPHMLDVEKLKPGLVIFRRGDVQHRNWYCRLKIPNVDRYKTISLKTADTHEAREKAYNEDAELRFKLKHNMPVFDRAFSDVAKEYSDFQKQRAGAGQITQKRWHTEDGYIRNQLNRYVGHLQITLLSEDKWTGYPIWRQSNGKGRDGARVSDWTIRSEMATFRAVMIFAARKHYIRENQIFRDKVKLDKPRREEFTPQEYRHLHTFARAWIKEGASEMHVWYRTMAYNFMLVMTNTGMRPPEAKNLRWRDIDTRTDKLRRQFVCLNVRGKGKYRELVAVGSVATYFERIRQISKATKSDDFVFTSYSGTPAKTLYLSLIEALLKDSGLLMSSSGKRRSTYCFRHTYATFRLMEDVGVYMLAQQMGTSVKMIEEYYGHITPSKNAERILQGTPGWVPVADVSGDTDDGVNAGGAGKRPAKPRTKK